MLAGEGMLPAAIAPIVGATERTVRRDFGQMSDVVPETGTGLDGKTYSRPKPAEPSRADRLKAAEKMIRDSTREADQMQQLVKHVMKGAVAASQAAKDLGAEGILNTLAKDYDGNDEDDASILAGFVNDMGGTVELFGQLLPPLGAHVDSLTEADPASNKPYRIPSRLDQDEEMAVALNCIKTGHQQRGEPISNRAYRQEIAMIQRGLFDMDYAAGDLYGTDGQTIGGPDAGAGFWQLLGKYDPTEVIGNDETLGDLYMKLLGYRELLDAMIAWVHGFPGEEKGTEEIDAIFGTLKP